MLRKLYTWGYTGSTPEDLTRYAEALDALVLDIRYSPTSRVPRWQRQALAALLGSRYHWLQAFGNVNYKSGGPLRLADPDAGLKWLNDYMSSGAFPWQTVILLCACEDWWQCHRSLTSTFLRESLGVEVEHLPGKFDQWQGGA